MDNILLIRTGTCSQGRQSAASDSLSDGGGSFPSAAFDGGGGHHGIRLKQKFTAKLADFGLHVVSLTDFRVTYPLTLIYNDPQNLTHRSHCLNFGLPVAVMCMQAVKNTRRLVKNRSGGARSGDGRAAGGTVGDDDSPMPPQLLETAVFLRIVDEDVEEDYSDERALLAAVVAAR